MIHSEVQLGELLNPCCRVSKGAPHGLSVWYLSEFQRARSLYTGGPYAGNGLLKAVEGAHFVLGDFFVAPLRRRWSFLSLPIDVDVTSLSLPPNTVKPCTQYACAASSAP
jgi:hypothetical protein